MMMRSVLASLFLVFGTAHALSFVLAPFVQEIKTKLADREDVSRISEYFSMTVKELTETLPVNDDQGNKNSYTFFAPTTAAFQRQLPQDIGDPFILDAEFRKTMILRHFARQAVTKDDLKKLTELKMGDTKTAKITHQGGVNMINEGEIMSDAIELGSGLGVIYIVDRVFVTSEEISEIIDKYPAVSPWSEGPLTITALKGNDETDQTPPGGYFEVKVDDVDVKEIANFATEALGSAANAGPVKLVHVKAAAKQVVAGANYKLALGLVKKTNDEGPLTCEVQVYDPLPSDNSAKRTMTEFRCVPEPARAPSSRLESDGGEKTTVVDESKVLGGYKPANIDDSDVKEMADFAATTIAAKANSKPIKVLKIVSASKQVVAGTNYNLTLTLVDSEKNDPFGTCQVIVWDQPWTKTRELTKFTCDPASKTSSDDAVDEEEPAPEPEPEPSRSARQFPGGYKSANVDDPTVKEMATFAATAIAAKSNSGALKVIEITSAATQVVAGTNYKLTLKLVDAASNGSPQTCEVTIWDQSWTKTRELTDSKCDSGKAKRETAPQLDGGYQSAKIDSPEVKEMATFAATAISSKTNAGTLKVVEITSAATQVVAGTNYKLTLKLVDAASNANPQTCEVTIWDQPWTKTRKLTDSKCNSGAQKVKREITPKPKVKRETTRKRLGGYQPAKVDDPEIKEMATFAATAVASKSNSGTLKVVEIASAQTQLVAGMNYKMTLKLVDEATNANPQTCEVVVFNQPWTNTRQLTDSKCNSGKAKRETTPQRVGGYQTAKIDDPNVKEMATFAATAIAAKSNSGALKVVEIASAATQVVSGTNYKLKLKLVDAASNGNPQTCEVTIWDQPWTKTRELTDSKCDSRAKKLKRETTPPRKPGGFHPSKIDDPHVQEMASYAVTALTAKTNSGPLKLVKITSAETQTVSGFNYKLVLQLAKTDSNNDEPLTCEVIVFDPLPLPDSPPRSLTQSSCGPTFPADQKVTKH